jgi:hypothetical protein
LADTAGLDLERYRPLIEAALADTGGAETFADVESAVRAGQAIIVPSPTGNSIAILQAERSIRVWGVAGDMSEVLDLEQSVTDTVRATGGERLTVKPSRKGWDRVLRGRGWDSEELLVKEL